MACAKQLTDKEGSTATVALLVNDDLYLGYVGDSAAMIVQGPTQAAAVRLCQEVDTVEASHSEVTRIEAAGGVVIRGRVLGELALTRAFGDVKYKAYVPAEPHIVHHKLEEGKDQFVVLATDGLWNVISADEVAKIVIDHREEAEDSIARALYSAATSKNSRDNITIVVINLEKRRQQRQQGNFCPPPAPTSRYAKTGKKTFSFGAEALNLID